MISQLVPNIHNNFSYVMKKSIYYLFNIPYILKHKFPLLQILIFAVLLQVFSPVAMKVCRTSFSVAHHLALGYNIFLSGHHTTHLSGNPTFEIRKFG